MCAEMSAREFEIAWRAGPMVEISGVAYRIAEEVVMEVIRGLQTTNSVQVDKLWTQIQEDDVSEPKEVVEAVLRKFSDEKIEREYCLILYQREIRVYS